MYRRYKPPTPDMRYSMSTAETILDICFTELAFCGLMVSLWMHHFFLTLLTLWKEMEMVKKDGGLFVFDTDIRHFFFANC